jgi:tRNA nucleotidyltransferase/poly(A) polymerase
MTQQHFEDLELLANFLADLEGLSMPFYFVGGLIRDMLFHIHTTDIDLVFVGDYDHLLQKLKEQYLIQSSNLLTLQLSFGIFHVDIVRARKETYPNFDGSPNVEPSSIEEDLLRRDFTINTAYAPLNETNREAVIEFIKGEKITPLEIAYAHPNFLRDINNKTLSALHDQLFKEDPTRLIRGLKYQVKKNVKYDKRTQQLVKEAYLEHYIRQLSQTRLIMMLKKLLEDDQWVELTEKLISERILDDFYHTTFSFAHKARHIQSKVLELSPCEKVVFRLFILYDVNYKYLALFYPKAARDYQLIDQLFQSDLFNRHGKTIETMLNTEALDTKEAITLWQLSQYKRTIQSSVFYAYMINHLEKPTDKMELFTWIALQNKLPGPILTGYDLMAMDIHGSEIAIYQGFLSAMNLSRQYHQQDLLSKEEARDIIKNKPIE